MTHYYLSSWTVDVPRDEYTVIRKGKTVEYEIGRTYSPETQDTRVKRCVIGKIEPSNRAKMYPNENYFRLFPENNVPEPIRDSFLRKCEFTREKEKIRKDPDEMARMVAEGMKMLLKENRKNGGNGEEISGAEKNLTDFMIIREMFDKLYYYMDMLAEKNPNDVVNAFKVRRINEVLEEFRAFVQDGEMKKYLQMLEEPVEEMDEKGNKTLTGMTYSDAMVLLKWYKSMPG